MKENKKILAQYRSCVDRSMELTYDGVTMTGPEEYEIEEIINQNYDKIESEFKKCI